MHPVARICGLLLFSFTIFARDVLPAPEYARAVTQVSEMIQWEMREKAIPAISIALIDDQTVVWSAGLGWPARMFQQAPIRFIVLALFKAIH